jgi:2-polyprenyl-3-methyl-5-hydroxy-6-metoxy-1,4-benzoquinol methylase
MNIDERLNKIEDSLSKINLILDALTKKPEPTPAVMGKAGEWVPYGVSVLNKEVETPKIETVKGKLLEFQQSVEAPKPVVETPKIEIPVELLNLLNSKEWPAAVDPALICDITSDQDKEDRAEGILDLIIDTHLENLKFLDFGCGEGHVINKSKLQNPKMSVGYDINKNDKWDKWAKSTTTAYTNEWQIVETYAPYNVILLYDVIDHMNCSYQELVQQLKAVKSVLAPNGKVYVRTHPWCSRHGTHLYQKLNKAYVHLILTNEEIESLGHKQEKTRKVIHPITEYEDIFTKAGFKIHGQPNKIREGVEPFFTNNIIISNRIKHNYKNSPDEKLRLGQFPIFQLEQQFIDYILL